MERHGHAARRRVCMVVHAQYPLGETRVQREAMALRDAGYEVSVICLRDLGELEYERIDDIDIHRLPVRRRRGRGLAGQLAEYAAFAAMAAMELSFARRNTRHDVIHVHNLPDFLVVAALVPKLRGARVVLDLHDLMPELFAARAGLTMQDHRLLPLRLQERWACRLADHVITVTDQWRDTLEERSAAPGKVSVVMNLADRRIFTLPETDAGSQGTSRRFEVLYHGTFTERYGVDLLVRATHLLRDDIPELHLSLLGAGETKRELEDLVDRLELHDRVTISDGMVPAERLPGALSCADVGVVPNRANVFTDGILPTKLLEYVAMGVPVVSARTAGVRRYFDDAAIEFFDPGDVEDLAAALRHVHDDPRRRDQMRSAAAEFDERHQWSSDAAAYVRLVDQLAGVAP